MYFCFEHQSFNMALNIKIQPTTNSSISSIDFSNLPFGKVFSDHVFQCEYIDGEWKHAIIKPNEPIELNPAAKIFHYGQSIFEGMKAYKDSDGGVFLFRPEENCNRLNLSAKRLMMPEIPTDLFMEGLTKLLDIDSDWIPTSKGSSLYVRPFMFASGEGLHASPADSYTFMITTAPSGTYFSGKITVLIEEKYARAANGGVGFAKAGGNYAAQFYPTQLAIEKGYNQVIWTDDNSHQFIEEAGAMNIFIRIGDILITSPTNDRILDGITRKSIIQLAKDNDIPVEVRKISVREVVQAAKEGSLKEMFGAGTAAVVSAIDGFGYQGVDYELPEISDTYASFFKKKITDIQTNKSEDKHGWRVTV